MYGLGNVHHDDSGNDAFDSGFALRKLFTQILKDEGQTNKRLAACFSSRQRYNHYTLVSPSYYTSIPPCKGYHLPPTYCPSLSLAVQGPILQLQSKPSQHSELAATLSNRPTPRFWTHYWLKYASLDSLTRTQD